MKRHFSLYVALLLGACGGISKQEFLQDPQNNDKFIELANKRNRTADCDKLGKLYNFTQIESPTNDDLVQILPLLGLTVKDATDIDKVYNINYSIVDKYNCKDNAKQLLSEGAQYCKDKYYDENVFESLSFFPYRATATIAVLPAFVSPILGIGALPFFMVGCKSDNSDFVDTFYHPVKCQKKLDCQKYLTEHVDYINIDKEKLKQNLEEKIKSTLPAVPESVDDLRREFKLSELIKANNSVLGIYDGNCDYTDAYIGFVETTDYIYHFGLCDTDTKKVTRLNAAQLLQGHCLYNTFFPDDKDKYVCLCYAHETYQKVNYKNLVYIYEKGQIPQDKQSEFKQILTRCKQKVKQKVKQKDKERYGE